MHTFKVFLQILKKNMPSIMLYTGISIVLILVVSHFSDSDKETTYKDEEIPFTVINRDEGHIGDSIKKYLSKKNKYIECADDIDNLRNNLFYRNIYYVLIIPEGYENAISSGKSMELENMKVKDSALGYYIELEVNQFMMAFNSYMAAGYSVDDALEGTLKSLEGETKVSMQNKVKDTVYKKSYYYYGILPYAFLGIIMAAVGPVYMAFNKKDVKRRINCSAESFKRRNFNLALCTMLTGIFVWFLLNIIPIIIYHGSMSFAEILMNLMNTLCMASVSVALAFLCGNIINDFNVYQGVINVVSMGLSFIGGVFVTLDVLSDGMQKLSKITPTYWYITANDAIVDTVKTTGLNNGKVFSCMGIQLLFAVAILGISLAAVKKFRTRD